jgi:hypothetical protein
MLYSSSLRLARRLFFSRLRLLGGRSLRGARPGLLLSAEDSECFHPQKSLLGIAGRMPHRSHVLRRATVYLLLIGLYPCLGSADYPPVCALASFA